MKRVVMLSTTAPGGMAQVVKNLRECGLFDRYGIRLISTHDRGSAVARSAIFIAAFAQFLRLLLSAQVSAVHAHVAMRGSFWRKSIFLWTARLFRRPFLVHLHGSQFETFYEKECGPLRQALVRALFRHAHAVIVLSENWRAYISRIEPRARVLIIHNFVNIEALQQDLAASRTERDAQAILFLGELGHRKGIYDLIRVMPTVLAECPSAHLYVGGTGEMAKVEEAVSSAKVGHAVTLLGWVVGADKIKALARSSVYVLPSYNENFPVSILEAMSAGIPVISTAVGGIPDMIEDGVDGYLIQPGEVERLGGHLRRLLTDRTLRERMGSAALRKVRQHFGPDTAIHTIETLYRECGATVVGALSPPPESASDNSPSANTQ